MLDAPNKDHAPLRQIWDILSHVQTALSNLLNDFRFGKLGSSYLMQIALDSLGKDVQDAKKRLEVQEGFEPRTPAYTRMLEDIVLGFINQLPDTYEIKSVLDPGITTSVYAVRESLRNHQAERAERHE